MCRIGSKENLYHCDKCDVCLPICNKDSHKCIGSVKDFNCPICLENIKISTKPW